MKRSINILTFGVLICASLLALLLFRSLNTVSASAGAFSGFPLNETRQISFELNKEALEDKSRREKLDQMRDWLLYAVASDSGRSARELSDILYDLPTTRNSYMHHVGNFEYGDTRSRLVSDGEVMALLPADKQQERVDQLAHIADEHRKNTGELPKSILVFDYTLNPGDSNHSISGEITRRAAIDGKELFTEKYGYYESRIKNLNDLAQFMQQVNDVVFARHDEDSLILGGRKILGRQYRGIGVEEIAAIWQSEAKIQRGETSAQGSGFSLDPAYRFDDLKQVFETYLVPMFEGRFEADDELSTYDAPLLRNPYLSSSGSNTSQVSEALGRCDIKPFFDWLEGFRATEPDQVKLIQEMFMSASRITKAEREKYGLPEVFVNAFVTDQKARYDGDLQGTEVGMVLFYTDLVAKLWDFDYQQSTPREIEDFKSEVKVREQLSPLYTKGLEETPFARLWFGPDDRGYQALDGQRVAFARNATRLFAKSSDSISQRDEVEPDVATASFINWWDDRFEEVARHEPQYERLNQIMKWSLIISSLNKAHKGDQLGFLKDFAVNRSHRFPEWLKQQTGLKFNHWTDSMFPKGVDNCTTTEKVRQLSSDSFLPLGENPGNKQILSGGVSLGSKTQFAGRPLLSAETKVGSLARRSGLDYASSTSPGNVFKTIEGTGYKIETITANRVAMTSTPKAGALPRTAYGDLVPGNFQHTLASEGTGLRVAAKYGDTGIGDLSISRTGNGFRVGWESRELDLGQLLARRMSVSASPDEVLTNNSIVRSAIKLPNQDGYLVKMNDSQQWIRLRQGEPSSTIKEGWQARFSDLQGSAKPHDIAWWDQSRVNAQFGEGSYLVVPEAGAGRLLSLTRSAPSYGSRQVTIQSGEQKIPALVDRNANSVLVKYSDLPEHLQQNPGELQRALGRVGRDRVELDGVLRVADRGTLVDEVLSPSLANKDYGKLTKELLQSPETFKSALDNHLADALRQSDDLLATNDYGRLVQQLDDLIELYGPRPELTIRKGIAQIQRGEVNPAITTLNESVTSGTSRSVLFDEVNLRLKNSGIQLADDGGNIALHYQVKTLPKGTRVGPEAVNPESGIFYIQDCPTLNNLDWQTNFQVSLKHIISGELGEVVKLPRGALTKYRPTRIYAADINTSFYSPRKITTQTKPGVSISIVPSPGCQNDRGDDEGCGDIYLIVLRSGAGN